MPTHENIFLDNTETVYIYVGQGYGNAIIPRRPNLFAHSQKLERELQTALQHFRSYAPQQYTPQQVAAIKQNSGTYLEFSGAEQCDLVTKSLEQANQGIRLMNVRTVSTQQGNEALNTTLATVFIPNGKEQIFINKIRAYAIETTASGKPKNNSLVSSIESISSALKLSAFWTGKALDMPQQNPEWCEIWLQSENETTTQSILQSFFLLCNSINIRYKNDYIIFPERAVVAVNANNAQLVDLISLCDYIAEIRKVIDPNSFFLNLSIGEQREWVDELQARTDSIDSGATVCILDTGVNYNHPLIENHMAATDAQAVNTSWGIDDHHGHGTEMAGVALYDDLKQKLITGSRIKVSHSIESVKILPRPTQTPNPPNLYGAVVANAVSLAEINEPNKNRAFCMSVTAESNSQGDGCPTSWSASIDKLAYINSTRSSEPNKGRLFLVSAGNVGLVDLQQSGYPDACITKSVEDPAQAWNAITVGAYSKDSSPGAHAGFHAVARSGQLSPFSATSLMWDKKWPIKPEIVCDGGNAITDGTTYDIDDELSKLTLHKDISTHLFSTTLATSAATAQSAHIASELMAAYPQIWPETIRALLVHSAQWTPEMMQQFLIDDSKRGGRRQLLRTCGYGVPSLERARDTLDNRINMIIQGIIQPYEKRESQGKMKEMHLHEIPWPTNILEELDNTSVKLKVTLSYFIEPSPGEKGWKDKYRYQSCGLRFDIKKPHESVEDFKQRINNAMREDDYQTTNGDNGWYLGEQRDVGSIHSDIWEGTAVSLSTSNSIAVYPVVGWWRERIKLGRINNKLRYALVISIETPKTDVDFYSEIITKISTRIPVEVPIR